MNKYNNLNFLTAWSKLNSLNEESNIALTTTVNKQPFINSKVKTPVYHGSEAKDLKNFSFDYKYGENVFAWFTPNFEGAKGYALDEGGYVHTAFIKLINPINLSHIDLNAPVFTRRAETLELSPEGLKLAKILGVDPNNFCKYLAKLRLKIADLDFIEIPETEYFLFDYIKSPYFRYDFEKYCRGNDGLICRDDQGISYAVMHTNQIVWLETVEVEDSLNRLINY